MASNSAKNYYEKLFKALKEIDADGTPEDYHRSLNLVVERWERESIDGIHQFADETRDQIQQTLRSQSDRIDENLRDLEQLLLLARGSRETYDQNLVEWSRKLQQLQKILKDQQQRRLTSNESSVTEPGPIETSWQEYPTDQEPSEFFEGRFVRLFKLEDCGDDYFLVMGIISGQASSGIKSYKNPTFYGWSKDDLVYIAGVPESRYQNYRSVHRAGTRIQLILDCDQRQVSFFNEKTQETYQLSVNLDQCPFPWVLCVYFQSFRD